MNKNIHMPGAAGERRRGGLERKDAGESLGRHQDPFQIIPETCLHQFTPYYHQQNPSETGHV